MIQYMVFFLFLYNHTQKKLYLWKLHKILYNYQCVKMIDRLGKVNSKLLKDERDGNARRKG